jgi:hypothetical protein
MTNEMCIPADAVELDGATPETGDSVSFSVEGTVTRGEGGKLYVKPTMINGEPVKDEPEALDPDTEMDRIAQDADNEKDY